jgi:hypothetical protein
MVFDIYKRGQGKYARLCSAFGIAIIVGLGCLQLYKKLQAGDLGLWVETMVPAGLFVILALLIFWLVNKPNSCIDIYSYYGRHCDGSTSWNYRCWF